MNLIASAVAFVLGFGFRWGYEEIKAKRIAPFWRFAGDGGGVRLVIGRFEGSLGVEPSGLMGMGDVRAMNELMGILDRARLPRPGIAYASLVSQSDQEGHLILFGGSDTNPVAAMLMRRTNSMLDLDADTWPAIKDEVTGAIYKATIADGKFVTDYGVLVSAKNPHSPRHRVVIIAGSSGFGTWGGVRLTRTEHFRKLIRNANDFACIFTTEIIHDAPAHVSIVTFRAIHSVEPDRTLAPTGETGTADPRSGL